MNDTQKRIILSQPWVERGGELVQVQTAPLTVASEGVLSGPAFQASITPIEYQTAVIKLANLCGLPMKRVNILERFRRVYLMQFVPHYSYDPTLPMATIALGPAHDEAYRRLVNYMAIWQQDDPYQAQWFKQSKEYVRTCVSAAVQFLRKDEAEYYAHQMLYSIANPDRRSLV
jgi:hypothetical protein